MIWRKWPLWIAVLPLSGAIGVGVAYVADPDAGSVPPQWVCTDSRGQLQNFTVATDATRKAHVAARRGLRLAHCRPGTAAHAAGSNVISFSAANG